MKLSVVHTGNFKLDGGAMFGVVPKTMWQKKNMPDENNMCTWAMRCLLIEVHDRKILIDTGLGMKQDDKFRSHFHPHGPYSLSGSLADLNVSSDEITDVFLTHMHFDHVGGALKFDTDGSIIPTFENAKYWSNKAHLETALNPNAREKASFLKENIQPLIDHNVLHFLDEEDGIKWIPEIQVHFVYGHTKAMMVPKIKLDDGNLVYYMADLMPSAGHISIPWVMAYDVHPLITLKEKERFFNQICDEEAIVFFEHDALNESAKFERNERGRIVIGQTGSLSEMLSQQ